MTKYINNWKTKIAFLLTTVMFSALIIAPNALAATGYTWTDDSTTDTATAKQYWTSITSSSNGQDLAAVALNGGIWTSTDGGANWTNDSTTDTATANQVWESITSSSNGQDLAAVSNAYASGGGSSGSIWTSTDGGANWTNDSATDTATAGHDWYSITSSSNGQDLAAVTDSYESNGLGGGIWTSTDGGANWTNDSATDTATAGHDWYSITSSSNGQDLAAVASTNDTVDGYSDGIWTSTDGGANWRNDSTTDTATANQGWTSITSSSNGQDLAAVNDSGSIWTSTDGGANWRNDSATDTATADHGWYSITSNSNGQDLAAVTSYNNNAGIISGSIWTSTDGGANWTNDSATDTATANQDWYSITSSSNGQDLAAIASYNNNAGIISGSIWTTNNHSRPSNSNLVVEILVIGLVVVIGLGLFLLYRHKKIVKR